MFIIRRRYNNGKIRGYTPASIKGGSYYIPAKIGGKYYGSLYYCLRGSVIFKTLTQLQNEYGLSDKTKIYEVKDLQ